VECGEWSVKSGVKGKGKTKTLCKGDSCGRPPPLSHRTQALFWGEGGKNEVSDGCFRTRNACPLQDNNFNKKFLVKFFTSPCER